MTDSPIRVLLVSTGGAARAILAEALLRRVGGDRFDVSSAGITPEPVDPLALRVLDDAGFDRSWAASRPVGDFVGQRFDYVITLCDDARLVCPVFPGADASMHWGYGSPAGAAGTDTDRRAAYDRTFLLLSERVRQFVLLARKGRPVATG